MRRTNSTGLRLDLTENTPDSSLSSSRLPNLVVEHAEALGASCHENLNSKLPNVVESSMDYGSERRSSRYLADYDAATSSVSVKSIYHHHHQDAPSTASSSLSYGVAETGYLDRGYHPISRTASTYDRKTATLDHRDNLERYDNRIYPGDGGSLRYDRSHRTERNYQESDLDAPYNDSSAKSLRTYSSTDTNQDGARYSRDLTDYDYARYAEETLKLEPKKPISKVTYEVAKTQGYDSGVKTNEQDEAYDLAAQQDLASRTYEQSKYHTVGKMYGTLPRYESSSSKYDSEYERGAASNLSVVGSTGYETTGRAKVYEGIKYELTTSKSYERAKYESSGGSSSRYPATGSGTTKTYEQTLKVGESSCGTYSRKNPDNEDGRGTVSSGTAQEKMNGYRKNNFEAYGVYSDPEDDHGFLADKKTPQYTYKGVVVNASGESSVVEQKRVKEAVQTRM